MSTEAHQDNKSTSESTVKHSHENAVDERTFDQLVAAAESLRSPFDAQATFILYAAGRLGMRAGEITHCRASWVDWDRRMIEVPSHEPCTCGYCKQQSRQADGYNTPTTYDDALAKMWGPKTPTSARAIPFDFDPEVEAVIEAFFARYDEYPHSRVSINRRVNRVLEAAGLPQETCYPHSLRATAATYHAYRGLSAVPLQSLMGWRKLETAEKYIRLSGGATAKALRKAHAD